MQVHRQFYRGSIDDYRDRRIGGYRVEWFDMVDGRKKNLRYCGEV